MATVSESVAIAELIDRTPDDSAIFTDTVRILENMLADWGVDAPDIGPETRLVADLEFVSVDIIHLAVTIEEHYKRSRMGFQELLMNDGRYVDDVTVRQLVAFVEAKLAEPRA